MARVLLTRPRMMCHTRPLRSPCVVFAALTSSALLCASCGTAPPAGTDDGGTAEAGCAADEHAGEAGCDTAITWATGPDLKVARDHHATFLVDPGPAAARFLYVAGGYSQAQQQLLTDVVRAPVGDDGSLGAWSEAAPLPAANSGMGVVVTHGEVILTGGFGTVRTWSAGIQPDGSLGAWTAGPSLSQALFHAPAVVFGDSVYVLGGLDGNVTVDSVQRATIDADGTLEAWQTVAHLPYTLSHESAVVDGSTLYVIGGQTGNTNDNSGVPHKEVWAAPLASDGSVGAFTQTSSLPLATLTQASVVHDGFVYVLAGVSTPTSSEADLLPTSAVLRAKILGPGALDTWEIDTASQLPAPHSHVHQTPMFGPYIYSVSGMVGAMGDTPSVFVGTYQ